MVHLHINKQEIKHSQVCPRCNLPSNYSYTQGPDDVNFLAPYFYLSELDQISHLYPTGGKPEIINNIFLCNWIKSIHMTLDCFEFVHISHITNIRNYYFFKKNKQMQDVCPFGCWFNANRNWNDFSRYLSACSLDRRYQTAKKSVCCTCWKRQERHIVSLMMEKQRPSAPTLTHSHPDE